jgi:hypothetical protein
MLPLLLNVAIRSYITLFEEWAIGDGCSVKACNDRWLGDSTCLADSMEKIHHGVIHCKVPDLVDIDGNWKVNTLLNVLLSALVERLILIPPPSSDDGVDVKSVPGKYAW